MMYLKRFALLYLFILFISSCTEKQNKEQPAADTVANNNEKVIEALFSNTWGEEEFKSHCITCHSLRYIEMQPAFPRKTWEKIVDKMVKTFGAPIPDSSAKAIVDYLVATKGKK
ncbi:MAG: cytochrome c [Bacteroidia bacterium]